METQRPIHTAPAALKFPLLRLRLLRWICL